MEVDVDVTDGEGSSTSLVGGLGHGNSIHRFFGDPVFENTEVVVFLFLILSNKKKVEGKGYVVTMRNPVLNWNIWKHLCM